MHLWDKKPLQVYGERMSESVLAILCHLLKGESIINEKLAKESGKTEEVSHKQVPQTSEASTAVTQPAAAAAAVAMAVRSLLIHFLL